MTFVGKIVTTVLFLPVAVLFAYSWIRIVLYLLAVSKAVAHVEAGKLLRYLMTLSSMNLAPAARLMATDAGRDAHDQVVQQFRRALRPTVWAIGMSFLAIGVGFVLQETGLIVFE